MRERVGAGGFAGVVPTVMKPAGRRRCFRLQKPGASVYFNTNGALRRIERAEGRPGKFEVWASREDGLDPVQGLQHYPVRFFREAERLQAEKRWEPTH